MKFISLVILILMMSYASSHAQDTTTTKLERAAYVVGAGLTFSLLDYVGYSLVRNGNRGPGWYRVLEGTVQAGISYFLYKECGLSSAISFNLIWWTWGDDFAYYGWGQLLSWFPWESRAQSGLRFSEYNSAGWTPYGLTLPQGTWIPKNVLIAQAVIGLSFSISILL